MDDMIVSVSLCFASAYIWIRDPPIYGFRINAEFNFSSGVSYLWYWQIETEFTSLPLNWNTHLAAGGGPTNSHYTSISHDLYLAGMGCKCYTIKQK